VGDNIKEGEPFACLDSTYLDLDLRANQAEREALKVDKSYFKKEVVRYSKLVKKNSSSQSQLDTAQRNLDKTQTQIEALTIAAKILQERKARLCIDAPAGWLVIKRHVEPGKWVNAGEPVVEVGDYSHLVAPFALSVAEYQALHKQLDKGLNVKLPELEAELPANIIRVSPAFDEQSRKIHLELELSDGLPAYRGGIRVDLALEVPTRSGAVLIPERALQQRYEQYWLKRPDGNEIAVVYLGRSNGMDGEWVRVVSPEIQPGDQFQLFDK
jgi:RND family efflux transporter MFP subunit